MYRNVHMPVVVWLVVEQGQWVDYGTVVILKCSHALGVLNALELMQQALHVLGLFLAFLLFFVVGQLKSGRGPSEYRMWLDV